MIFKPFYKTDHARHDYSCGLGLSIVKSFVEEMKGKVWATSKGPGLGATFYISLPLAKKMPEESV